MPAWGACAFLKGPLLTQSVSGQTSCWPGLTALTLHESIGTSTWKSGQSCLCLPAPLSPCSAPPATTSFFRPPALGSAPLSWKNRVLSKPPGSQRGVAQPGHFLPWA